MTQQTFPRLFPRSFPRLSRLTLAAVASLMLPAATAWANPVLGASSTALANGIAGMTLNSSQAGYEGSQSSASQLAGNSSANSFASSYGAYVVRSTARGKAASTAHAQLLYTLTNTSGVAQTYTMSFHIYGGSINTNLANSVTGALTGAESLSAQYAASIKVGNTSLFSTTAAVARNAAGTSGSLTGTVLNALDDATDGSYSWASGDYVVDLGLLANGASLDILAELDSAATADVGTYVFNGGGGYGNCGYGDGGPTASTGTSRQARVALAECFKGTANGSYGDPSDFFGNPDSGLGENRVFFVGTPASGTVPEPGSLLLAALALVGAAGATQRKRS